jgi:malate synthase
MNDEWMIERAGLWIDRRLAVFIEERVLPGLPVTSTAFWSGMAAVIERFVPWNRALLAKRDELQRAIDQWYLDETVRATHPNYLDFLGSIGYRAPEPAPFQICTAGVDPEIATLAGPQLIVPALNARYVLNAANARWGSLFDALYGTDAVPGPAAKGAYDPLRGAQVIAWGRDFLDEVLPLAQGRWQDWTGELPVLRHPAAWVGRVGKNLLFRHHGLHIELVIDREHPLGRDDPAGLVDVRLEAALTTIVDLEDSIAAVDAEDKVAAYANWLGLMRGDLETAFEKNGTRVTRRLHPDRAITDRNGQSATLPGRSLLMIRNCGLLMTTPMVRLSTGAEVPEGIVDGLVTTLIGLHDVLGSGRLRNSRARAIYIVKPKMHGPEEAKFTDQLFDAIEDLCQLPRHTIKLGLMDEERRTSVNLAACIEQVRDRVAFINTGFLDRTGDEIHSAMRAGPMIRKSDMRRARWMTTYEDRNVQIGLACGFAGKAQIGKGMWAMPDRMRDMLAQKIAHPQSGANTAWVPSPTAATLHATHYHRVDVAARQIERQAEPIASLDALLEIPLAEGRPWSDEEIRAELENNVQGILGYVVRWIDQGIGCSKVPDIHDVGLMEDRATLRISSQHIANWLLHGVCTEREIEDAFQRMAKVVDAQNAQDPRYQPMLANGNASVALQAARALVFEGLTQPNGYTEPLLHGYRAKVKASV